MAVGLVYGPILQFLDDTGVALPGAKLYSYLANTSTPAALYVDHLGATPHPNPAIADAAGRLLAYGTVGQAYKLNLLDTNDVQQPGWPVDYVTVASPPTAAGQLLPVGLTITATPVIFAGASGAQALVASGGLPTQRLILLVQVAVAQQFGTGQGAVSLACGDATLIDRWGGGMTLTVGVKPLQQGGLPLYQSATDLILSIEGGQFDGTGAAEAIVYSLGLT